MAQPERRPRVDSYGKPLPELALVEEQALFESVSNKKRRTALYLFLEDLNRLCMHRGFFGDVWVRLRYKDGTLLPEIVHTYERETHLAEE